MGFVALFGLSSPMPNSPFTAFCPLKTEMFRRYSATINFHVPSDVQRLVIFGGNYPQGYTAKSSGFAFDTP